MKREISYSDALREAQEYCLESNPNTLIMGLGVPDPKGIFGSTLGLQEKFGADRVMDIPLSENALTGVAIGAGISGCPTVLTHQRVDFSLVSIEQIVNQAAKWHYMFDGAMNVPIVIRMIIGRGWGQGPQHSQSIHNWFAHVPGLKVIMPSTPYDAKGMLISAIEDENPVICMEHRWLYNIKDVVPEEPVRVPLNEARVMKSGKDITMVGVSYMALECLRAAESLAQTGIDCEVIDLRSIRPIDSDTIVESVRKTKRILVVDNGHIVSGISGEIVSMVTESLFNDLISGPVRMGFPDYPTPTSPALSDDYYVRSVHIEEKCLDIFEMSKEHLDVTQFDGRLDQPDPSFTGPF